MNFQGPFLWVRTLMQRVCVWCVTSPNPSMHQTAAPTTGGVLRLPPFSLPHLFPAALQCIITSLQPRGSDHQRLTCPPPPRSTCMTKIWVFQMEINKRGMSGSSKEKNRSCQERDKCREEACDGSMASSLLFFSSFWPPAVSQSLQRC